MKKITTSIFLFLYLVFTTTNASPTTANAIRICPLDLWDIYIFNHIKDPIHVHVKSKDDDLGDHILALNQKEHWSFCENVWKSSMFYADFNGNGTKTASFHVFDKHVKPHIVITIQNLEAPAVAHSHRECTLIETSLKVVKEDELFPYRKMKPKKKDDLEQGLVNNTHKILNERLEIQRKMQERVLCVELVDSTVTRRLTSTVPSIEEVSTSQLKLKISLEKMPSKSIPLESVNKLQQKNTVKKLVQKSGTKLARVEAQPPSSLKAKVLKSRTEDIQVESHKWASLVILPPVESNIIRNPPRKTIVIKRHKNIIDLDRQEVSPVMEPQKTKRMTSRDDRQIRERNGSAKRNPVLELDRRFNADYIKRRRRGGGQVIHSYETWMCFWKMRYLHENKVEFPKSVDVVDDDEIVW
nr:plant self-incompatibility S1 [Tanacetum cinerariifolium]